MKITKNIFLGLVCSTVFTMVFILIFSLILTKLSISESHINTIIIIIYGTGMFFGTAVATRKIQKNGAIIGTSMTMFYVLLLYIVSSFFTHDFSIKIESIYMLITTVILGGIGGVIGVNIK